MRSFAESIHHLFAVSYNINDDVSRVFFWEAVPHLFTSHLENIDTRQS